MESRPSFSGRLNQEDASSSSSSSSCKSSIFGDHNLSSILNNPHSSRSSDASWLPWSSSSSSLLVPEFAPIPTPSASTSTPTRSDFLPYLSSISDHFTRFQDIRNHSDKESVGADQAGGDALVACLREVPSFYFKEDFQLQDGPTFLAACPFTTLSDNLALQNRLSHYLDLVEFHLLHEISRRSNSFFQAQHHLSDLSLQIVQGCQGISDLKRTIRLLDSDLVGTAHLIQDLTSTRSNLLSLHHKLRLIFYVNHALTALNLLVASSDTAAALDVADDLQHLTVFPSFLFYFLLFLLSSSF